VQAIQGDESWGVERFPTYRCPACPQGEVFAGKFGH
jgi:hypothetical protein